MSEHRILLILIDFPDFLADKNFTLAPQVAHPWADPGRSRFTFGGKELAYFCGTIVSGAILSRKEIFAGAASHWLLYSIATGPAAVITFPAIWNWFGEEQLNAEAIRERRRKIFAEKEVLFLFHRGPLLKKEVFL